MSDKPSSAAGYAGEYTSRVRQTCLYLATVLGDLMEELVVVGGLVPSLLIDQDNPGPGLDTHVGTLDLDIGITVALLDQGLYRNLTDRMRRAGFSPDQNREGNQTRQRWRSPGEPRLQVSVDFLIQPTRAGDRGGRLRNIESDFAAIIAPGLHLAFLDRLQVTISGRTIRGEDAERNVWVCGPGAFVVLKAIAFELRGENKDAYDLFYLLRNYGQGVDEVARSLRSLREDSETARAIEILRRDFSEHNDLGPRRTAQFIAGRPDDDIQADVVGFVAALLKELRP